jgi:tetratricopeptide (TPR) repeat protein
VAEDEADRALQLAGQAYERFDIEGVVTHLSAAVRELTAAGEPRRAAMACVQLGDAVANGLGNLAAGRAWFARAARLVAGEPPCVEQGWAAVAAMGCDVGDPDELLAAADLALDRARRFGDVNLEAKALADGGLALVQAGHLDAGMARLDEAMALACGPADDPVVASKSVCSFFTACYYAADLERADSWADLLRRRRLLGPAPADAGFLNSHCDMLQATLLCELGRWGEAEAVLTKAIAEFEAAFPVPSWHPAIGLADLRIRQGRLAEAEALLVGKDQAFEALLPAARLHLARGDHDLARAAAARGLRALGSDRLRALQLLAVSVDAELACGDLEAAAAACEDLVRRTAGLEVPALAAQAAAVQARVLAAGGEAGEAIGLLESTVDSLDARRLPWLRATLLLDLAGLRERAGDPAGATLDAKAAAAALAPLDVVVDGAHADLLARLAEARRPVPGRHPAPVTATLGRDGKWWVAASGGTQARLQETKGLRYLAELVARPGVERHALDLVDRVEGTARGTADRRALGDAGPVLDGAARAAYRRRVEDLRAQVDEALAADRTEEAEACEAELGQLVAQLAQAFGLGGRDRRAASAAERARLNVTRALRTAIGRVADALPAPGAALDRGVRTGLYCAYEPAAGEPVRWVVQSGVNGGRPS